MKYFLSAMVAVFLLFSSPPANQAAELKQIVSTAKGIVERWNSLFSKGVLITYEIGENPYWTTWKIFLLDEIRFDVKKTDSLISPYRLILSFPISHKSNAMGPRANFVPFTSAGGTVFNIGYRTAEESLNAISPEDFRELEYKIIRGGSSSKRLVKSVESWVPEKGVRRHIKMIYGYNNDAWDLTGGNEGFRIVFEGEKGFRRLLTLAHNPLQNLYPEIKRIWVKE